MIALAIYAIYGKNAHKVQATQPTRKARKQAPIHRPAEQHNKKPSDTSASLILGQKLR